MEVSTKYVAINGLGNNVGIHGIKICGVQNEQRRPTHFILLLDTSGSMESDHRLASVKNCVRYMLSFLSAEDRISIIRFSDSAEITVSFQATTTENRAILEGHINSLYSGGSTNLSAGLLKVREVMQIADRGMKTGLVILTDGFANMGMTDESSLRSLVGMIRVQYQNVSVSTIGYGTDHEAQLLRGIALEGGGSYNIVSSEEHVGNVFAEVLGGLVSCVAQNVEVVFPKVWSHYSGYACREVGGHKHLFIGDIYSQGEVIVLLCPAGPVLDNVELKGFDCVNMADVRVRLQWSVQNTDDATPYKAYYVRWRLGNCLERISGSGSNSGEIRNQLDDLEIIINGLGAGPMVDMLRAEIVSLRGMLDNDQMDTTMNIQRSAFLSTGRGGATQTIDDPVAVPDRSMFLTPVQRQMSAGMSAQRQR